MPEWVTSNTDVKSVAPGLTGRLVLDYICDLGLPASHYKLADFWRYMITVNEISHEQLAFEYLQRAAACLLAVQALLSQIKLPMKDSESLYSMFKIIDKIWDEITDQQIFEILNETPEHSGPNRT